ncbi:hypothetical protein V5O48_011884 [Marasmius crinis-equi]|uniref:Transmembrane protein n=1 Tax=Marasmius crinis-equi TaxID=585013 RepID=A0ABR3F4H8_9AGAR
MAHLLLTSLISALIRHHSSFARDDPPRTLATATLTKKTSPTIVSVNITSTFEHHVSGAFEQASNCSDIDLLDFVYAVTLDLVEDIQSVVAHLRNETRPLTTQSFFTPIRRVRQTAYIFITLLADGIVALRAFIVWKLRIVVAVVPWILFAFVLVSAIVCSTLIGVGHNESKSDLRRANLGALAFFGASLASNMVSTGLLVFKIYRVDRESSRFRITTSPLLSFVRVAIDSGLIYTVSLSLTIAAYVGKFLWKEVLLNVMPSAICIAFYLMLIRIARTTRNQPSDVESVFNSEDMALRGFSVHDTTALSTLDKDVAS